MIHALKIIIQKLTGHSNYIYKEWGEGFNKSLWEIKLESLTYFEEDMSDIKTKTMV